MWKYLAIGFGALMIAIDVSTGALTGWTRAKDAAMTEDDARALLQEWADDINPRKGEHHNQEVFMGARVDGLMLQFDYELGWAPKSFNRSAHSADALRRMQRRFCHREIRKALTKGGAVKYVYRDIHTKQVLFDATLRDNDCGERS